MEEYTNDLIRETSPYLLQHAHNPVDWVAWSEEVLERAKRENKMILVSVGYSACHWCHVMEKECFEDEEVAALMNKFFINIKVDREERPDVDQLYMTAVQLMTNKGGWPLNCFTLPDGRPIYGGTYFPKEQWMHVLRSLQHSYSTDKDRLETYAAELMEGIQGVDRIIDNKGGNKFEENKLNELILRWSKSFDHQKGGPTRAPKFPLPNNMEFLLDIGIQRKDTDLLKYVETTLDHMAMGGIYDQIGGGFARYSVDMLWKVPHFEKMLYDNGQLISLYSRAYKYFQKELYKYVVYNTVDWLEREMADGSGAFYAALDADSEGEEGRYYVWTEPELKELAGSGFDFIRDLYSVGPRGYWEDGNLILLRSLEDKDIASAYQMTEGELYKRIAEVNQLLLSARSSRIRPGTDTKKLTSWNAVALRGLCEAYKAFGEDSFLTLALRNARWLRSRITENSELVRSERNDGRDIKAFLEDYAFTIDAFISLTEITGDEDWLYRADELLTKAIADFRDESNGMFYITGSDTELISRKLEVHDNVMPSGNSVMARNLYYLGRMLHRHDYINEARRMLSNIYDGMEMYGSSYSNWAFILEHEVYSLYEFVCVGPDSEKLAKELNRRAIPTSLVVFDKYGNSSLPVFEGRGSAENRIYVCIEGTCLSPVKSVTEALSYVIQ